MTSLKEPRFFAESRKKKPKKRSVHVVHEHFKVFSNAEYVERLLFSGESCILSLIEAFSGS